MEFTEALIQLVESMTPIREAVIGYRRAMIEAGFGTEAADIMAADFHKYVLTSVLGRSNG